MQHVDGTPGQCLPAPGVVPSTDGISLIGHPCFQTLVDGTVQKTVSEILRAEYNTMIDDNPPGNQDSGKLVLCTTPRGEGTKHVCTSPLHQKPNYFTSSDPSDPHSDTSISCFGAMVKRTLPWWGALLGSSRQGAASVCSWHSIQSADL